MTPLMKIQPFIQAYVQAIASILEADVTIVDHELIRVAGTGDYLNEIGNAVSHANFFEKILKTGKGGIIRDVNDDSNCVGCGKRAYCKELANLAYPIFQNQTVVGIISIIAFREQQRKNVLENMGKLEEFLKYMSMLLLQEKQVERIGGRKPIPVDIRVICATHKNIEKMVAEGTFREDLYYRLNIIPIELPPLRMRREDLPALITHYIGYYNQKLNKHLEGMEPEALDAMIAYDWPGNVRELKNIVEYLANIVEGTHVTLSDLPDHILHSMEAEVMPRVLWMK